MIQDQEKENQVLIPLRIAWLIWRSWLRLRLSLFKKFHIKMHILPVILTPFSPVISQCLVQVLISIQNVSEIIPIFLKICKDSVNINLIIYSIQLGNNLFPTNSIAPNIPRYLCITSKHSDRPGESNILLCSIKAMGFNSIIAS